MFIVDLPEALEAYAQAGGKSLRCRRNRQMGHGLRQIFLRVVQFFALKNALTRGIDLS